MSGDYGATHVECVKQAPPLEGGPSYSDYRAWAKIIDIIRSL